MRYTYRVLHCGPVRLFLLFPFFRADGKNFSRRLTNFDQAEPDCIKIARSAASRARYFYVLRPLKFKKKTVILCFAREDGQHTLP